MHRLIANITYIVLGLFLVSSLTAAAYQWWFVWPVDKCDRAGAWWDVRDHQCLTPLPVWRITGRLPTAPAATKPKG